MSELVRGGKHLIILGLFALAITPLSEAAGPGTVEVQYKLGSDFVGHAQGTCDAAALMLPRSAQRWTLESDGGSWTSYRAQFNHSKITSPATDIVEVNTVQITTKSADIPSGLLSIERRANGRSDVYAGDAPFGSGSPTIPVQFEGSRVATTSVTGAQNTVLVYDEYLGAPVLVYGGINGDNRGLTVADGSFVAHGDVTIFLEDSTVIAGGRSLNLPPREETGPVAGAPGLAELGTSWENWGLLTLKNARISISSDGSSAFCQGLKGQFKGTLNAYAATGSVQVDGKTFPFESKELQLVLDATWEETPSSNGVSSRGTGRIESASLDYGEIATDGFEVPLLVKASLWATLLAGVAAGLWYASKFLVAQFTRLDEAKVIGHAGRRLVLETVKAKPNVTLHGLVATTRLSKSEVRYHARVLERHGLLRSHKFHHDRLFVAKETIQKEGRQVLDHDRDLVAQNDPVVGEILRALPPEGARMNAVLTRVADALGISRVGGWKAVLRAERYGLVQRWRHGREVWVRSVT